MCLCTKVLQKSSYSTIMMYFISRQTLPFTALRSEKISKFNSTTWQRGAMVLQNSSDSTVIIYYMSGPTLLLRVLRSEKISKTQQYHMIAWYHGTIDKFRQYHHDVLHYIGRQANFAFYGVKIRENLINSKVPHVSVVPWQYRTVLIVLS